MLGGVAAYAALVLWWLAGGLAGWLVVSVVLALGVGTFIAVAARPPVWRRLSARASARAVSLDRWLVASGRRSSGSKI